MPDKVKSVAEVVQSIPDGSHIALGGFAIARNAIVFAHEVIRQQKKKGEFTFFLSFISSNNRDLGSSIKVYTTRSAISRTIRVMMYVCTLVLQHYLTQITKYSIGGVV